MGEGEAVLKLQLGNPLQEPKKSRAFLRCQFFSHSLVGGNPRSDEVFPVFVAFRRQCNVNSSA